MNIERDKYLTEAMGECWHLFNLCTCVKCRMPLGFPFITSNNDFSTWEGFGKLFEFCQKQEWWESFIFSNWRTTLSLHEYIGEWINPDRFSDAIYDFLQEFY